MSEGRPGAGKLGKVVSVSRSMTPMAKFVEPELATQSFFPSAETAKPTGDEPIGIVFETVNVVVSMTTTVLSLGTVA
ncbi:MAG: hypothetical protein ACXWHF_03225 [Chthoniobacterales bacterium]